MHFKEVFEFRIVLVLNTVVDFPLTVNFFPTKTSFLKASRVHVAVLYPACIVAVLAVLVVAFLLVLVFTRPSAVVHFIEVVAFSCSVIAELVGPLSIALKFLAAGVMTLCFATVLKKRVFAHYRLNTCLTAIITRLPPVLIELLAVHGHFFSLVQKADLAG